MKINLLITNFDSTQNTFQRFYNFNDPAKFLDYLSKLSTNRM